MLHVQVSEIRSLKVEDDTLPDKHTQVVFDVRCSMRSDNNLPRKKKKVLCFGYEKVAVNGSLRFRRRVFMENRRHRRTDRISAPRKKRWLSDRCLVPVHVLTTHAIQRQALGESEKRRRGTPIAALQVAHPCGPEHGPSTIASRDEKLLRTPFPTTTSPLPPTISHIHQPPFFCTFLHTPRAPQHNVRRSQVQRRHFRSNYDHA